MDEEVVRMSDDSLCVVKKYDDGTYAAPAYNDFDYQLDLSKLLLEIESKIYKHSAESTAHMALKKIAYVFIMDKWGMQPHEVHYELTDKTTSRKLRPDITCRIPHLNNAKVAIECGHISYRDKLEDLVIKCDFDAVVWIPSPENTQIHYLTDVCFINASCQGIGDFKMGRWTIDYAKVDGKIRQLKYSDVDSELPDKDVVIYFLFRKSFVPSHHTTDDDTLKQEGCD